MTPLESAAYIMAQAAALNARVQGMTAENQLAVLRGRDHLPYGEQDFSMAVTMHDCAASQIRSIFAASTGEEGEE